MTSAQEQWLARVKVVYLLIIAAAVFYVTSPLILTGLLVLQTLLWIVHPGKLRRLFRTLQRLVFFFLVIILSYAFFTHTANDQWQTLTVAGWQLEINRSGIEFALLMSLRVVLLIFVSNWVQSSGSAGSFLQALIAFRLPKILAISMDAILNLLASEKKAKGKSAQKKSARIKMLFSDIRQGRLTALEKIIDDGFASAKQSLGELPGGISRQLAHDIPVIVAIGLAFMSIKLIQLMPGLPVAPGHKNILMIPLLLLASSMTQSRLGGFWTGTAVGLVSFMLGYGKFGLLEIAHFAIPGLMADLLLPLARARSRLARLSQFIILGALIGMFRFASNFLIIVLAGAPLAAFVIYLPMLISQVMFGGLSAFVSIIIIKNNNKEKKQLYDSKLNQNLPDMKE